MQQDQCNAMTGTHSNTRQLVDEPPELGLCFRQRDDLQIARLVRAGATAGLDDALCIGVCFWGVGDDVWCALVHI